MCAIDALGIPAMLGCDAVITSADPVSGDPVQVRFTSGVAAWQPAGAVVFYGVRPESGPAASVCCGYLRFFATRATAGQFAAAHPEAGGTIWPPAPRRNSASRSSASCWPAPPDLLVDHWLARYPATDPRITRRDGGRTRPGTSPRPRRPRDVSCWHALDLNPLTPRR
jgi:hypothetical protein